jgi:hypothetical protein
MAKKLPHNVITQGEITVGTYRADVQIGKDEVQKKIYIEISSKADSLLLNIRFCADCYGSPSLISLENFGWSKEKITITNIQRMRKIYVPVPIMSGTLRNRELWGLN